jgi:predicted nucleic acid-binding protein
MIYLDTGCLIKLYYPEPNSAAVVARVAGRPIYWTPVHELELTTALCQKQFQRQATPAQVAATLASVATDLASGLLVPAPVGADPFRHAVELSLTHTPAIGCRSMDILHCAIAADLEVLEFITTDHRQSLLAQAIGLPWTPL